MNHRTIAENDRGTIALIAALVLVVMMGMGAVVLDGGLLAIRRRQIQSVAAAAALAGGAALPTSATAITDARTNANVNGYTNGAGGVVVTVNSPYSADSRAIEVIVQKDISTFLATRFFGMSSHAAGQRTLGSRDHRKEPPRAIGEPGRRVASIERSAMGPM